MAAISVVSPSITATVPFYSLVLEHTPMLRQSKNSLSERLDNGFHGRDITGEGTRNHHVLELDHPNNISRTQDEVVRGASPTMFSNVGRFVFHSRRHQALFNDYRRFLQRADARCLSVLSEDSYSRNAAITLGINDSKA